MSNWKITILWLASVVLVFLVKDCVDSRDKINDDKDNYAAYLDTIRHYKDKYDRVIDEKSAMVFESQKVIKQNDSLKEFIKGMKPEVVIKMETVYRDTGTIKFDTVYQNVYIPFSNHNKWRNISGVVKGDGIHFDTFDIYMKQHIAVGTTRKFFGSAEHVIRVINENPYVTLTDVKPIVIKEKKRWYERWWLWGIVGVTGGILISK